MARKRMIDPDFWTDEKLGDCTRDERLLFMGLISNADDEGRGRANPKLVKSTIFPYDEDLTSQNINKMLELLDSKKLIQLYTVDGQEFYHVTNFKKHQVINRKQPSKLPEPPINETSQSIHTSFTEYSVNSNGMIQDGSVLREEKRKEEKLKEKNIREEKQSTLSLEISKYVEKITNGKWFIAKELERLSLLIEMYTFDWIKDAVSESVKRNKYSMDYVEGILKAWTKEGREKTNANSRDRTESEDREGIGLTF